MKVADIQFYPGASIHSNLDWNGRYYICYCNHVAVIRRDRKSVRQFFGFPLKTPSRERFDAFMDEVEAADAARAEKKVDKEIDTTTGFGPECHLDESDPNFATRTVI